MSASVCPFIAMGADSSKRSSQPGILVEDLGLEITAPLCAPRLLEAGPDAWRRRFEEVVCIESQLNPVRWADWCKLNGLRPSVRPSPSFDRGSLAVAAAVDGLGVALETLRFAEAELARGELVALVEPEWTSVQRRLHFLCYRESEKNQPDLKTFVQWLKRELGPSAADSDAR